MVREQEGVGAEEEEEMVEEHITRNPKLLESAESYFSSGNFSKQALLVSVITALCLC